MITVATWGKAAMRLNNPKQFWVVYHRKQSDRTCGAQKPIHGSHRKPPLECIHRPPSEYRIDDIQESSDDDAEMRLTNPTNFPIMKSGFQQFEKNYQR